MLWVSVPNTPYLNLDALDVKSLTCAFFAQALTIKLVIALVGLFTEYVACTIYGASLLKSKRCKQNKAIQSKINLYIDKYIKRKHYEILRIF